MRCSGWVWRARVRGRFVDRSLCQCMSSERFFGEMPGVPIGSLFSNRQSLHDAGGSSAAPTKMMNSARTKLGREK